MDILEAMDSAIEWRNDNEEYLRRARAVLADLLDAANRFVNSLDAHETIHADDGDDVARMVEYAHAEAGFRRALAKAQGGKSDAA